MAYCEDSYDGYVSAVVYFEEIHRRVNRNKEPYRQVARDLGLWAEQVSSVVQIGRSFGGVPSKKRLALIAMLPPDITDEEVACMFGESLEWVQSVKDDEIPLICREWIPKRLQYIDGEMEYNLPSVEERSALAARIRGESKLRQSRRQTTGVGCSSGIRQVFWQGGRKRAFFQVGT